LLKIPALILQLNELIFMYMKHPLIYNKFLAVEGGVAENIIKEYLERNIV